MNVSRGARNPSRREKLRDRRRIAARRLWLQERERRSRRADERLICRIRLEDGPKRRARAQASNAELLQHQLVILLGRHPRGGLRRGGLSGRRWRRRAEHEERDAVHDSILARVGRLRHPMVAASRRPDTSSMPSQSRWSRLFVATADAAIVGHASFAVAQTGDAGIPRQRRQGSATQLVVDGAPFLIRGGELGNSTASCLVEMRPIWPKLRAMHLNTVAAPVYLRADRACGRTLRARVGRRPDH